MEALPDWWALVGLFLVKVIGGATLYLGDSRDVLETLADNSVDAVVTDPPYALEFMGKVWDTGEVAFSAEFWRKVLRIAKPGAHVLAFGGTRTYHRLACAIEDAGFEIRDQIGWAYGTGFPKSSNQEGEWEGWGTALKPAWEPIVMARKPLIGTVPQNLTAQGVGALNIDGCRIHADDAKGYAYTVARTAPGATQNATGRTKFDDGTAHQGKTKDGRCPANLVHDGTEEVVALFPAEAGAAAPVLRRGSDKFRNTYNAFPGNVDEAGSTFHGDTGSAARFYYCAKASKADRDDGVLLAEKAFVAFQTANGASGEASSLSEGRSTAYRNTHPTVKPTDLMRWLCRLVTPKGGTVLDPFMGSGSTGRGALFEDCKFIGIEMSAEYFEIAGMRITRAASTPKQQELGL